MKNFKEARNCFLFFSTLTYNNEHLPHFICENGFRIPFADVNHLQILFQRLRNDNSFGRPFRYLAVSERGKEKARPHFHILWFLPKYKNEDYVDGFGLQQLLFDKILHYWAVNRGSRTKPDYVPLLTYRQKYRNGQLFRNYDTHFVTPALSSDGISSVAFYVCKYMMKASDKERRLQQALRLNLSESGYDEAYSIVKSKSVRSSSFGFGFPENKPEIVAHLKRCVQLSKGQSKFPMFFSPDSQATFPLCPYYKSSAEVYTLKDHLDFHMDDDSIFMDYDKTLDEVRNSARTFQRIQQMVDSKDLSLEFNWLYE